MKIFFFLLSVLLFSCAGTNPNPGERTADMDLIYGNGYKFVTISEENAKRGYPWAILRAGMAYGYGFFAQKNPKLAKYYLEETTKVYTSSPDGWQSGRMIFSFGKTGFFNSNTDALLAYYHLAKLFYKEDADLALKNLEFIQNNSKTDLFFCCEFAGGRGVTIQMIEDLKKEILQYKQSN